MAVLKECTPQKSAARILLRTGQAVVFDLVLALTSSAEVTAPFSVSPTSSSLCCTLRQGGEAGQLTRPGQDRTKRPGWQTFECELDAEATSLATSI